MNKINNHFSPCENPPSKLYILLKLYFEILPKKKKRSLKPPKSSQALILSASSIQGTCIHNFARIPEPHMKVNQCLGPV